MLAGASSGVAATGKGEIKQEAEAPKTKKNRKTRKERDGSDTEETKKVEMRRRGVRRKIKEEEAKPSIDDGKSPEMIRSVTCLEDEENLTVDDLLSFAHEYVKGEEEEEQAEEIRLIDVNDESIMRASKGETNGTTRDPTSEDMINLLLGPFFKKSGTN